MTSLRVVKAALLAIIVVPGLAVPGGGAEELRAARALTGENPDAERLALSILLVAAVRPRELVQSTQPSGGDVAVQ